MLDRRKLKCIILHRIKSERTCCSRKVPFSSSLISSNYSIVDSASPIDACILLRQLSISRAMRFSRGIANWFDANILGIGKQGRKMAGENEIVLSCSTMCRRRGDGGRNGGRGRVVVGCPVRGNFPHLLPNNSHGNEVTAMVSAE